MYGPAEREVIVWDVPTRLFHWLLMLLLSIAWCTGGWGGWVFLVHRVSGYGVLVLLLFRIGWGVFGGRYARFRDFVRGWASVKQYGTRLAALDPPEAIGHNPIGGWMIVTILVSVAIISVTGLFGTGHHGRIVGPFAPMLSAPLARALGWIHGALSNAFPLLIGVHIAGVIVEQLLTGDNLVGAMLNGRKRTAACLPEAAVVPATVPAWRAAFAFGVAIAIVWVALGR